MLKQKINLNAHSIFYLIIGITFLVKVWAIFYIPFHEDELDYVRTAFLIKEGYVPFKDYIHISFPLFSCFLILFVSLIPDPIICLFTIKVIFLLFSYLGLIFYYKAIQKWFPKNVSMLSAIIHNFSYIFYYQTLMIRPSTLLFPVLLFCFWFIANQSVRIFLKPCLISFVFAFFILLDQRSCILVFLLIFYGVFLDKSNLKIFLYTVLFVTIILGFVLSLLNPVSIQSLMKMAPFFPNEKYDQSIFCLFFYWRYDWFFLLSSISGVYSFYSGKNKFSGILFFTIFYCLLSFVILSALRPDTFGIYILPYVSLFSAIGLIRLTGFKFHYYKFLAIFILVFGISLQIPFKKEGHISLDEQLELLEVLHKDENQSVMNLSRFSLNIRSPLYYPILRFEEDIFKTVKNLKIEKEFYETLLKTLQDYSPEKIIYSEKDDHVGLKISSYISQNYIKKSSYLYELKKSGKPPASGYNTSKIVDQMFKMVEKTSLPL